MSAHAAPETRVAQHWARVLAAYRDPSLGRSLYELGVTVAPFAAMMALAVSALSVSVWLAGAVSAANGFFLVRLFMIQHDCGHGSFFPNRSANDWTGRVLGVLTLTPYDVWRRTHSIHHSAVGDLDRRGVGDVPTLTVGEYRSLPLLRRLAYRTCRHPVFMFGIVPAYLYFFQQRLPIGLMRAGKKYWVSAMATNAALLAILVPAIWVAGLLPVASVFLPMTLVGASIGVWLFYVQHQFEETYWERSPDWTIHDAALWGSSYYILPPVLRWFAANIGLHHVHHLCSRIPYYRLSEAIEDHPDLGKVQRLTVRESLRCAARHLWDEDRKRLVSFSEARLA